MTSFTKTIQLLKQNDAKLLVIDFSQTTLTNAQLAELKEAMQQNTVVGRIKWGQVEDKALQGEVEQLVKRNNANYRDRPSDYEYAMLSEHVYETLTAGQAVSWTRADGTAKALPDWQVHTVYQDTQNGYYGAAYYHPKHHFLVLCHRGTDFKLAHLLQKTDSDIHADIQLSYNKIITQQVSASAATQEMIALAKLNHWHFSLSGHSLGGWLAQVSLLHCHQDYNYPQAHAVVFDAPGVASMEQRLQATIADHQVLESVLDIKNYVAAPNVVNTLHKPFGRMYRVFPKFDLLALGQAEIAYDAVAGFAAALFGVTLLEKFKSAIDMLSSAPGHAITGIVDSFNADTGLPHKVQEVISWPVMRWPEESAGMDNAKSQLDEMRKSLNFAPSLTDFKWANAPTWLAQLVGNWATQKALKSASYYLLDTQLVQVLCLLKDVHDKQIDNKALLDFLKIAKDTQQVHVSQASLNFEEGYHLRYQAKYHTESYQANRLPQRQLPLELSPFVKAYRKHAENLFALREDLHPKQLGIKISDYVYKRAMETHKSYDYLEVATGNIVSLRSQLYRYWQLVDEAKNFSKTYQKALVEELRILRQSNSQGSSPALQQKIKDIETKQQQLSEQEISQSLDLDGRYQALVSHYQAQSTLDSIDDKWQPSIEDAFVNLAIVEEAVQREVEKKQSEAEEEQSEAEAEQAEANNPLLEPQSAKHISVEAIANQNPDKPQRTLVLGRPGIGKSVLCHYIARRWSQGLLWNDRYKWVFWLKLRSFTNTEKVKSWLDILNDSYLKYPDLPPEQWQVLEKTIREEAKNGRVLFLLDGYDEIAEQHQQTDWVYKKALDELLAMPQVIVTSRPYYTSNIKAEVKLEILGFTPDNIQTYVKRFFSNQPKQAKALQQFIQQNPSTATVAHIPINLYMLCTNWQEHAFEADSVNTLTRLYSQMMERLLRRYLEKSNVAMVGNLSTEDVYEECLLPLSVIERLAWQGMENDQVEFKGKAEPITKMAKALGLAKEDRKQILSKVAALGFVKFLGSEGKIFAQKDFHFIHYSFQEFLAARYFVNKWSKDKTIPRGLIGLFKFKPNFEWVWAYVAGLLEHEPDLLDTFLQQLLCEEPVDLVGMYSFRLLVRCLDQAPEFLNTTEGKRYLTGIVETLKLQPEDYHKGESDPKWLLISYQTKQLANTFSVKRTTEIQQVYVNGYNQAKSLNDKIQIIELIGHFMYRASDEMAMVLIAALQDEQSEEDTLSLYSFNIVRENAAWALVRLGQASERVVKALVTTAQQAKKREARMKAVRVLGQLEQENDEVVKALLAMLQDKEEGVREEAAEALGHFTQKNEEVVKALLAMLQDKERAVRGTAFSALSKLDRASDEIVRALIAMLQMEDGGLEVAAAFLLCQLGQKSEKVASMLIATLPDKSEIVRNLITTFQNGDEELKQIVAVLISQLARNRGNLVSMLIAASQDEFFVVRMAGVYGLGRFGQGSVEVIQALIATLRDKESGVRLRAVIALNQLGQASEEVVRALIAMLQDEKREVREETVRALGQLSQKNEEVFKALLAMLEDNDEKVCEETVRAFGQLRQENDEVIRALIAMLQDNRSRARWEAARVLGQLGQENDEVVKVLIAMLKDNDRYVRKEAVMALGQLGQENDEVVKALLAMLQDEERLVVGAVGTALINLRKTGNNMVSVLIAALQDKEEKIRSAAAYALREANTELTYKLSGESINTLIKALQDREFAISLAAAYTLARLNQISDEVINALITVLKDKEEEIKKIVFYYIFTKLVQVNDKVLEFLLHEPKLWEAYLKEDPNSLAVFIKYFLSSSNPSILNPSIYSSNKLPKAIQLKIIKSGTAIYVERDNAKNAVAVKFYRNKKLEQIVVDPTNISRVDDLVLALKNKQLVKVDMMGNAQVDANSWPPGCSASELPAPAGLFWPQALEQPDYSEQYITYEALPAQYIAASYSHELVPVMDETLAEEPREVKATQAFDSNVWSYFHLDSQLALLNVVVRGVRQWLGYQQEVVDNSKADPATVKAQATELYQQLEAYQAKLQFLSTKLNVKQSTPTLIELQERISYYDEVLAEAKEDLANLTAKHSVTKQQWAQLKQHIEGFAQTLAELQQDCRATQCKATLLQVGFFQPQRVQSLSPRFICLDEVMATLPENTNPQLGYR